MTESPLNPDFDEAKYLRQMKNFAPARRCYLIVFTPRSGSTWLTTVLLSTGLHGQPREYLNEEIRAEMARRLNASDGPTLLEMLKRKRKTPNGVFGMKVTSTHIKAFGEQTLFDGLGPDPLMYMLWRENIVAQGISAYRAVETQKFHSYQAVPGGIPPFDEKKVARWVSHILEIENENCALLARHGATPRILCYEDILTSREAAIACFAEVLSDTPAIAATEEDRSVGDLSKLGDAWNDEAEARFRAREKKFVADIEARRVVKTMAGARPA